MSVPFYNLLFNLHLDPHSPEPIYLQVAGRVAEVIRSGKLQPRAPMPGTRTLAKALGISRNAAIAAYGELHAQGWIQTEVGFGTTVAAELPDFAPPFGRTLPSPLLRCGFDVPPAGEGAGAAPELRLDLREPGPDSRLVPEEEVARAFRRPVARAFGRSVPAPDPLGLREVRECLCGLLSERRALSVDPEALLLVGGTREALGLVARNLLPPGCRVAVEEPGNPRAWEIFSRAGLEVVPVPVDAEGLRPEALEDVCIHARPRALYLTPNCQWPTGAVLGAERRAAVLELAGRYRMAVLEDDHAAELYYEERDWRPLIAEDRRGVVIHLGGFERILGPAFGLGFVAGPREAVALLGRARAEEGAGDLDLVGGALRDLVLDGSLLRHVRKARTAYKDRRDQAHGPLAEVFSGLLQTPFPVSGLASGNLGGDLDLDPGRRGGRQFGIALHPPRHWVRDPGNGGGILWPFGSLGEKEAGEALAILRRVRPKTSRLA